MIDERFSIGLFAIFIKTYTFRWIIAEKVNKISFVDFVIN